MLFFSCQGGVKAILTGFQNILSQSDASYKGLYFFQTSTMHISPNSLWVYLLVIILILNIIIIAPWPVVPFREPDNTDGAARCHGEWQYHSGGTRPVDPPLPGEDSAHCKCNLHLNEAKMNWYTTLYQNLFSSLFHRKGKAYKLHNANVISVIKHPVNGFIFNTVSESGHADAEYAFSNANL